MDRLTTYLAQLKSMSLPDWSEEGENVIAGVQLLAPGRYNGTEFSKETVRLIAANTKQLEADTGYQPPWVMGHERDDDATGNRFAMGFWRNFRMDGPAMIADLVVLDQYRWMDVKRGGTRYNSIEVPWHTTNPKTGEEIGPTVCAVAAVDVPAVRSASLFREGAAPVNLSEFPELAELAGVNNAAQQGQERRRTMFERLKALLGLARDATDEQAMDAVEQRLKENAQTATETPEAAALRERAEAAEAEAKRLREEQGASAHAMHRERVKGELVALREKGILPPALCEKLEPVLGGMAPEIVVRLGEGDQAEDVSPASEILEALKGLGPVVLREGQAITTPPDEAQQRAGTASAIAKAADKAA
jgi:hypothetical protein